MGRDSTCGPRKADLLRRMSEPSDGRILVLLDEDMVKVLEQAPEYGTIEVDLDGGRVGRKVRITQSYLLERPSIRHN